MGQKLSELRGFMVTMENEDADISDVENGKENVENGNEGEADEHFEIIYSNRNEPSTSEDALNGNVVPHEPQCPALDPQCTCAAKCRTKSQGGAKKKVESIRTVSVSGKKKTRPRRTKERETNPKKRNNWGLRLNCARLKTTVDADIPEASSSRDGGCVCTGYRRTDVHHGPSSQEVSPPVIDLARFNPEDFPIEDCDERARMERAREMAEGVDPPPGFQLQPELNLDSIAMLFQTRLGLHAGMALSALSHIDVGIPSFFLRMHSQADFIHCLVPDLQQITASSFYWGKMDRYEAERLLEDRPEGTFLLRDSAQEEHLFSVSFRKYGRSLHARIEQWNHRFSFDSHDPGVFSSPTVCGLIEHYKDSSFCMFFEPMLTISLHRNFPFPLQHLCRSVLCSLTDYDSINKLPLPKCLKSYLREYHYKQRVRVRNLDTEL